MVTLDKQRFEKHFATFVSLAEAGSGLTTYVDSLEAKHRLFAQSLAPQRFPRLGLDAVRTLLETVFTARRKLFPYFERMGDAALRASLLHGGVTIPRQLPDCFRGGSAGESNPPRTPLSALQRF